MPATELAPLFIGDVRIDRVVDLPRFELGLRFLFPGADPAVLEGERGWLEPGFMAGEALLLSVHSLVLRVAGRVVLVDTCVGEGKHRPRQPPWDNRAATGYLDRLAAVGLRAEEVDVVFCTHLHADHVGWNTVLRDGRWVPTFPRARYLAGRDELAHWEAAVARNPGLNHGSFGDSVLPVVEAGQVDEVEGGQAILDGVTVRALPGHTPGQVGIDLVRGEARAILCGDAIHHPVQLVRPEWSSAFCSNPGQAHGTRMALLEEAAERGSWLVPAHFRGVTGMRVRRAGGAFRPLESV